MNLKGEKGFVLTFLFLVLIALGVIVIYFTFFDTDTSESSNDTADSAQEESVEESDEDIVLDGPESVLDLLEEEEDLSEIYKKILKVDINLAQRETVTYFLPVNNTFSFSDISDEAGEIEEFLKSYTVSGIVTPEKILESTIESNIELLDGSMPTFVEENGALFINGSEILELELTAQNAIVYKISGTY